MRHAFAKLVSAISLALLAPAGLFSQSRPSIEQFMSPSSPLEMVSARKADRVAWISYERGMRNVYTAAAPDFRPVRLTSFLADDGIDVTDVNISDDGATVVFVRGSAPNREGWVANPSHDPEGGEQAIWVAHPATGTGASKVVRGADPVLAPDGRSLQIGRAHV